MTASFGSRLLRTVSLLAWFTVIGSTSLKAADFGAKDGIQWSPYLEWTLENSRWNGNVFDVRASVVFKHDSTGETRTTEMFYTGGNTWAFRFTGTQPGVWSVTTSSRDDDLNGHFGKVRIMSSAGIDAHGFLKKFDAKWGWQGTETAFVPQLVMWDYIAGNNSPRWYFQQPEQVGSAVQKFIGGHGFSGFHVSVVGGRWFDLDADSDKVKSTMTNPDPRTFEALELLITRTHQAGGMVHLWAWGDHQRSQTPRSLTGGIGGEVDLRLQRYIAARLGPVPGWSMGYGFDLDEWVTAEQVKAWRDSVHETMGWNHFLGGRPEGPNRGKDHAGNAIWNQGLDYSSYEHHQPTYEVYRAAIEAVPGQPVMSEDRFRIRKGGYPEKDYNAELTRRGLYNSTLAGGVANIWGIAPDLSSAGLFPNQQQIKTYSVFFVAKHRFLPDMEPANHLSGETGVRVLFGRKTKSVVLYAEDADSISINLSDLQRVRPAVAVDTRKAYQEIYLNDLSTTAQTIQLPEKSDWVVAVGSFSQ